MGKTKRIKAEGDFSAACHKANIWCHKWQDVMRCRTCGTLMFPTRVNEFDQRDPEEQESIIDYLIFTDVQPHWVECKGTPSDARYKFASVSIKQRNFLTSWHKRGVPCWLFISLGIGRYPARRAWFIPWDKYVEVERAYLFANIHSLNWRPTDRGIEMDEFELYQLEWKDGDWVWPNSHPFFKYIDGLPSLYEG